MKALFLPLFISLSCSAISAETDFFEVGQQRINFKEGDATPEGTFLTFNKSFDSFYLEAHIGKSNDNTSLQLPDNDISFAFNTSTTVQSSLRQNISQRYIKIGKRYPFGETGIIDLSFTAGDFEMENGSVFTITEVESTQTIETKQTTAVKNDVGQTALELVYHDNITDRLTGKIGIGYELNNGSSRSEITTFSDDSGNDSSYVFIAGLGLPVTDNIAAKISYRDANEYNELSASLAWRF